MIRLCILVVYSENLSNIPATTRVPTLSSNEVSITRPGHAVLASGTVGVGDIALAIRPEGVVIAIASSSRAGSIRFSFREISSSTESA